MAITAGFFDRSQLLVLPSGFLTWDDLGNSPYGTWASWTRYYQDLNASTTTMTFVSEIFDAGSEVKGVPIISLTTGLDGSPNSAGTFISGKPTYTIEASNNSNMTSAVSTTLSKDTDPYFDFLGSYRYYRVSVEINVGSNTAPQGMAGITLAISRKTKQEVINEFVTSTVDDGSTVTRTIPTSNTYSKILSVTTTSRTAAEDTDGYVTFGNSVPPLIQLTSASTNSFTLKLTKHNSGAETDATIDAVVLGFPRVGVTSNGNINLT